MQLCSEELVNETDDLLSQDGGSLLRDILDRQSDLVCRRRHDGRILFANVAYCRFFGRRVEELPGSTGRPQSPETPSDDESLDDLVSALTPERPRVTGERHLRAANGARVWMQCAVTGVFDADGRLAEFQTVARDVDDRRRIEVSSQHAQEFLEFRVAERTRELRQLAMQITVSEDRERRRIAHDLHDDLGQLLHVMKLKIEAVKAGDAGELQEIDAMLDHASWQVRTLTSQLGSRVLEELGLCNALRWLCDEMERGYGLAVTADIDSLPSGLPSAVDSVLFRGIRELLINVTRHARIDQALLLVRSNGSFVKVVVEDGGGGSTSPVATVSGGKGFGLSSLRERVLLLGGLFRVDESRRGGFRVEFLLPLLGELAGSGVA
ncbi:PAS domain-containing sensor histidine kinase [Propionivibrio sp.]|uniref:PAS domain-containing sensor histidine kinase n=1 Tax=Propionivibrio sp. TaxID=2212460 RepID=UPI00272E2A18|nr:PAS domain S-box protein [Propionivibrio sp.]